MRAFLIKPDKEIGDEFIFTAYKGFSHMGIECIFVKDINELLQYRFRIRKVLQPSDNDIVVAGIEDTMTFFNHVGIKIPEPIHIPNELLSYCMRDVRYMTLGEFKSTVEPPIFIKSVDLKLLTSGVVTSKKSYDFLFPLIPDDTKVIVSSVLDIVSEYRVFVNKGKILGMKHYLGDFFVFPDVDVINKMLSDYKSQPKSCTLDVGITSDGKTILIESQDAWSIGSYGLEPQSYVRFLVDRWIELIYHGK